MYGILHNLQTILRTNKTNQKPGGGMAPWSPHIIPSLLPYIYIYIYIQLLTSYYSKVGGKNMKILRLP